MFTRILLLALLLPVGRAEAVPALFFDGTLTYTQSTGIVALDAGITATEGLSSPVGAGIQLAFTARFASITPGPVILASLDPVSATSGIEVVDGSSATLLAGDLTASGMGGPLDSDLGLLAAEIHPTGGLLFSDFGGPITLFASIHDLSPAFGATLFDADFSGDVDGRIAAAIPEPATGLLLLAGLPLLFLANRLRATTMLRTLLLALLLLPAGRAAAAITYPALDIDTFAGDVGLAHGPSGALTMDATAYQVLLNPATPVVPSPLLPSLFSLLVTGTSGTLTVGTPGSELLTATFDNFQETAVTLLGITSHTFTADLAYTGGTYAGNLTTGRIEGAIQSGGPITARIGPVTNPFDTTSVPEPTSLLLLGSTSLLLLARRRTHR